VFALPTLLFHLQLTVDPFNVAAVWRVRAFNAGVNTSFVHLLAVNAPQQWLAFDSQ
jgi:hypothetical protein